jgi:enoyl-CoA hydratase
MWTLVGSVKNRVAASLFISKLESNMNTFENLIVVDDGAVRTVTVSRPAALNALNHKTVSELSQVFDSVPDGIRCVIVTGAGDKAFVAGADITEFNSLTPETARGYSEFGHRTLDKIGLLRVPVIAAVNGFALGGGLELALACDFIYASDTARLGLVEADLGIIPGFGGVARLSRRVGKAMASDMIFSATKMDAAEALRVGLVNRVCPAATLMDEVKAKALQICKRGPVAVAAVKRLLREGEDVDQRTANAFEQTTFGLVFSSDDKVEGVRAFLAKDKGGPQFREAAPGGKEFPGR